MPKNIKICLTYSFILIMALSLIVGCGDTSDSRNTITDKAEMIASFGPVNEAILHFGNLKEGTIIAESTGSFMPGGTAVKDELNFEKTEKGIYYKITETYREGDPLVNENVAENGVLPESAYLNYPNEILDDKGFDTAVKLTISKSDKGTEYRVDWSLTQFTMPEGITLKELYSTHTVDNKGYLIEVLHRRTYTEKKIGEVNNTEKSEYAMIKLTDYVED